MILLGSLLAVLALCQTVVSSTSGHGRSHRQRAEALLKKMTWEEKVGQLGGIRRLFEADVAFNETLYNETHKTQNGQVGFGALFNWAEDVVPKANTIKKAQVENSRLHIPFITVTDSINGLLISGGTVFPGNIAMSTAFNIPLFKESVAVVREELLAVGVNWVLSPELDVAWEQRHGRIGELFGEDAYVIGEHGLAYVETMQDRDSESNLKVACTIKHFVYGDGRGGVNMASQYGGINHLFNDQLRPYMHIIENTEPASLMVSYASVDLVPMSKNGYMLQTILRGTMGFKGLIMSDAYSIPDMYTSSLTATSLHDAALEAVHAGLQMELCPGSGAALPTLLDDEHDSEVVDLVDRAVLQFLEIKFATGLFERPVPDLTHMKRTLRAPKHLETARQMARESIVMLKNDDILPKSLKKVAVIGPYADIINAGSYAAVNVSDPRWGDSLYLSMRSAIGASNVNFVRGCDFIDTDDRSGIQEAVEAAKEAGFAVVMLGALSTPIEDPLFARRTDGEFFSHADLGFPGLQQELLDAILDAEVPTVLILSGGQPFVLNNSTMRANAIFHSWLSGEFTGDAIVELMTGKANPSGKLTVSLPQHTGAFPIMYDHLPSDDLGGFSALPGESAWQFPVLTRQPPMPFGFGLSYTTFNMTAPTAHEAHGAVHISLEVSNTGKVTGKEVVQVYHRPATTREIEFPVRRLVRFAKIELEAGETRTVEFSIPHKDLGYWVNGKRKVESGLYHFWTGASSRAEDLQMVNVTVKW